MLPLPALPRLAAACMPALALLACAGAARAQATPPPEPPTRDVPSPAPTPDPWALVQRPWLYASDPTAPPPGHVLASLGVGYAPVNRGASRPFAGDIAHAGAVFSAGAEVGIFRFASLKAEGLLAGEGSTMSAGAMIGANIYPLDPTGPIDLAVSGGYLRELGGANGLWGRVAVAGDLGPARLVFTALGEHVFATPTPDEPAQRDDIDLVLTAGASFELTQALHLGAEYVVQDLEGVWDPEEAEGGVRHFVGPVASLELARRVRITAGPAFGLSSGSPNVLGRLAAMYAF
jgi:hypothetical protein